MAHELICSWLKIAVTAWPPDHYTLLGLPPGEADAERIERHVHVRMEWVRRYQLAHPDLATEAMNRLAQAFDCLRNPEAKKAYDTALVPPLPSERAVPITPASIAVPPKTSPAPLAPIEKSYLTEPPAVAAPGGSRGQQAPEMEASRPGPGMASAPDTLEARSAKQTLHLPSAQAEPVSATAAPPVLPEAAPLILPPPSNEPLDPALEAARSAPARRGLGTKRALIERISRTRRLIRAWVQAGKYLGDAEYRLTLRAEAIDLVRQLTIIRHQLQGFPPLLGQAGQTGYLVIALARQAEIVKTYQALAPSQRTGYVRDWQAGLAFLAAYRLFLRGELSNLRRQSRLGRMLRLVRSVIIDFPVFWLFSLGGITANITWPGLRSYWPAQTAGLLGGFVLFLLLQKNRRRRSLHRVRRHSAK